MAAQHINHIIARSPNYDYILRQRVSDDPQDDFLNFLDLEALVTLRHPVQGVTFLTDSDPLVYSDTSAIDESDVVEELILWAMKSGDLFQQDFVFNSNNANRVRIVAREHEGKLRMNIGFITITVDLDGDARAWFETKFVQTGEYEDFETKSSGLVRGYVYVPREDVCRVLS